MKGFYHIWAWRPSWSCNQHHVNKFSFPCTSKLTYKKLEMAQWFLRKASFTVLILSLAFIASSFRVTEENLVFETVQSGPYSSFECFLCSLKLTFIFYLIFVCKLHWPKVKKCACYSILTYLHKLNLPTFMSHAAIVSGKPTHFTFTCRKALLFDTHTPS